MKNVIFTIFLFFSITLSAQNKQPEDYGFRHLKTVYNNDTVDILLKSKKGDEYTKKPLFLFCQGSLPIPLIIKYDDNGKKGIYNVFLFNPDSLSADYHLAIISKPYVPLIADKKFLNADFTFNDTAVNDTVVRFPKKYNERNLLDYYVKRNIAVIDFLQKLKWVSKNKLVVAGHAEGSTIAAKIALLCPKVTHCVYSGGNPLGRILSVIERKRATENDTTKQAEEAIENWEKIVADSSNMNASYGDTYKATYQFSIPPIQYLQKLKIPVFVCYGTKDVSSPYNDYCRIEMMRQKKKNFTFKAYIGTEQNYFPLKTNGETNYEIFNIDKVACDWQSWLNNH